MEHEVVVRRGRRRDWRRLRRLLNKHFPEELPFARLDAELWDLYPDTVVATLRGAIVGLAWVRHGMAPGLCWLDFIAVDSEHARQGIGAKMLAAAEELAGGAGETRMGLAVRHDNAAAIQFYKAAGFVVVGSGDRSHRLEREIDISKERQHVISPLSPRTFPVRMLNRVLYAVATVGG